MTDQKKELEAAIKANRAKRAAEAAQARREREQAAFGSVRHGRSD